jgi:hypothetical protein
MKRLGILLKALTCAIMLAFAGLVIHAAGAKPSASTQNSHEQEKEPCPGIRTCHFFMGYL